jgi:hypothetical protein
MHLVKWIRKNRNKLMAGFVVVIMIAFIMPPTFNQLTRGDMRKSVVAFYGDKEQITTVSREEARAELSLLRDLYAPQFLASQPDFNIQLLGEVLFFEPGSAEVVAGKMKETFARTDIPASDAAIDNFFRQIKVEADPADLWILLNAEADSAGISSSDTEVTQILSQVIPVLTKASLRDFLAWQISRGTSQETILQVYAKLIKVFRYAQMKTAEEMVTPNQLKNLVKSRTESIDPNLVRIDALLFVDANATVTGEQLAKQFDAFKEYLPGDYTDTNPYGFGYKLPSRVQLEYMTLKLEDVKKAVAPPTVQEKQAWYQQNLSRLTSKVPDPNDPNNPEKAKDQTKSYSEVADAIGNMLYNEKVEVKANAILADAAKIVDRNLEGVYVENISDAEYKKLVGSYEDAAKVISEKHGIRLYAGRTGMLSSTDFNFGRRGYTGSLFLEGRNDNSIPLSKISFAVAKLDGVELGAFDVATPRMYETIGPLADTVAGQVKAVVRVVDAAKEAAPKDLSTSYSVAGIRLDEPAGKGDVHSVEEAVAKDLRLMAAMTQAGKMADELKAAGAAADWKPILEKWNEKYARPDNKEPFTLQSFGTIRRNGGMEMWTALQRIQGLPEFASEKAMKLKQMILARKLFDLLAPGESSVKALPAIVKFEAGPTYYLIKTMSLNKQATTADYDNNKAMAAYYADVIQGQVFALVHYSPRNIQHRMAYRQWQSKELAAAISSINSGDYSSDVASGGDYTDAVGKRFSAATPKGFMVEPSTSPTTYEVPATTRDGQVIPMGGKKLLQSVVNFRSGNVLITVQVRQSYWEDFDRDFESIKQSYYDKSDKTEPRLTKIDGVRAGEVAAVKGKRVSLVLFLKKDGQDHLITITSPVSELSASADAIAAFLKSYHSLAQQK